MLLPTRLSRIWLDRRLRPPPPDLLLSSNLFDLSVSPEVSTETEIEPLLGLSDGFSLGDDVGASVGLSDG